MGSYTNSLELETQNLISTLSKTLKQDIAMAHCRILLMYGVVALLTVSIDGKNLGLWKSRDACIAENMACTVVEDGSGKNLLAEYNQTNRVGCHERCFQNLNCQHWTWWGNKYQCQLFNECQPSSDNCIDCLTGPRTCGKPERDVAAISGGLSDLADGPNQNKIYFIDEFKICSQPSFIDALQEMPRSRWGHVSAFIESKFFVCGGTIDPSFNRLPDKTCDAFDFSQQDWIKMSNMNENRHNSASVSIFGKLFVLGGHNGVSIMKTVEVYDPERQAWSNSPEMQVELTGHCAVAYKDSIIVMGGTKEGGLDTQEVFKFNLTSNKWIPMAPMMHARTGHGCSLNERKTAYSTLDYEIIVTGGESEGKSLITSESFDLTQMIWSSFPQLPFKMANHAQLDFGSPRLYGGDVSNDEWDRIIQYDNAHWDLVNVTLPRDLKYHHATKYPANLVKC